MDRHRGCGICWNWGGLGHEMQVEPSLFLSFQHVLVYMETLPEALAL